MKKLIPILLLAFISQVSHASGTPDGNNAEGYDKGEKGHPNKAPKKSSAPLISYNQGVLSISTYNTLYDAEIIIRDTDGNVIYDVVDTISGDYNILLPVSVSSKIQSVEIVSLSNICVIFVENLSI